MAMEPGIEDKWRDGTLTPQDIEKWLWRNWDHRHTLSEHTAAEQIAHIATCCYSIYQHYTKGHQPGSFVTAVTNNNLYLAATKADDINRHNLHYYALFLGHAPIPQNRLYLGNRPNPAAEEEQ